LVHWGTKVEFFDVMAKVSGASCADDIIPQDFGGGEVCSACCEFTGVVNNFSTDHQVATVRIIHLSTVIDNNSCVCDISVTWDGRN
jgi:hypothetical protein